MVAQNTVVLGAVAGAAAVAAGYDMYKKAKLNQAKKEAERKEDEIQAERLQRLQESLATENKRGRGEMKGWPSELVHSCRIRVFERRLHELHDALQNEYATRAAHPIQRLPLIGTTESPSATIFAVLYLWGDPVLYSYFVYQDAHLVNKEELVSSGFALSQLSERTARLVANWLRGFEEMPLFAALEEPTPAAGDLRRRLRALPGALVARAMSASMRPSPTVLALEGAEADQARAHREGLAALADTLGLHLHDCRVNGPLWTQCVGVNGPLPLLRWSNSSPGRKARGTSGGQGSQAVILSNFSVKRGFDQRLLVKNGQWFTSSEVISEHNVTSLQDRGIELYTRRLLALEAGVLRRRAGAGGGALAGAGLEHCQALSGSVKLFGCERGSLTEMGRLASRPSPDLLPTLRFADVERLVEGFDEVADALRAELRPVVPPPPRPGAAAAAAGAAATVDDEVEELVAGLVQLLEMCHFVTPVNSEGLDPARCRLPTSIASEAATLAGLDGFDDGNSEALGYQLSRLAQRREADAALHVRAPVWFLQTVTAIAMLLLALAQLVCWYNLYKLAVSFRMPWAGPGSMIASTAMSGYPSVLVLRYYRALRAGRPSLYLSAVYQFTTGNRLIEAEVRKLRDRCKEILNGWSRRLIEAFMRDSVRESEVESGRALRLMEEVLAVDGPAGYLPGPAESASRFLALEVVPSADGGAAPRRGGPLLLGDVIERGLGGTRLQARGLGRANGWDPAEAAAAGLGGGMVGGQTVRLVTGGEGVLIGRGPDGLWQLMLSGTGKVVRAPESSLIPAPATRLLTAAPDAGGGGGGGGGGGRDGGGGATRVLRVRELLGAAGWEFDQRPDRVAFRFIDPSTSLRGR